MGLIFMRLKCKGFKILTESTNFIKVVAEHLVIWWRQFVKIAGETKSENTDMSSDKQW